MYTIVHHEVNWQEEKLVKEKIDAAYSIFLSTLPLRILFQFQFNHIALDVENKTANNSCDSTSISDRESALKKLPARQC